MHDTDRPSPKGLALISKEEKLKEFILSYLVEQGDVSGGGTAGPEVLLVARSPASPVAKAVAAVAAGQTTGFALHVIFMSSPARDQALEGGVDVTHYANAVGIIASPRFADVHEQLVLGASMVWFGDSMRREPEKRDAFERYMRNNNEAGRDARRTFTRLWTHASPVAVTRVPGEALDAALVGLPAAAEMGLGSDGPPTGEAKPN